MVDESKDSRDLLRLSFQAIEHPELIHKASREIQKAAYCSILGFLLIIAAIQISSGYPSLEFVVIVCSTMIFELLSVVFLASGFVKSMISEKDRRRNGVLFANAVLKPNSDEAITEFRMYNIRFIRTYSPGSYLPFVLLTIMGLSLQILQIIVDLSGETHAINLEPLFAAMSEFPVSLITLFAIIILGTGIFGMGLRFFSDAGIKRWQTKSRTQILIDAEKLVSTYSKGMTTTYEEAAKLMKDAEDGDFEALGQTQIMADGMAREVIRFRKIRHVYCLAIIILSIIDIIFILLP